MSAGVVEQAYSAVGGKLVADLIELRHNFHKRPETGFAVEETARTVEAFLAKVGGFMVFRMVDTAVIADIQGKGPAGPAAKCIALRSDMDALEMNEENPSLPYRSEVAGKAHMCGHDGHMAMLLGAASLISANVGRIPSNFKVRLLFQPAEEGPGGAEPMVAAGCMDGVDEVYGIHNFPFIPLGEVRVQEGPMMAHITDWTLEIVGRGGHGSIPHCSLDPIAVGCQVAQGFNAIIGTSVSSKESAVLVVTGIHSGTAQNVIPDTCTLFGSIRDFSPSVCATIRARMQAIVDGAALAAGGEIKTNLEFVDSFPVVMNAREPTVAVQEAAALVLGAENVTSTELPILASEDFSYFSQERPGCFLFLGGNQPSRGNSDCHNSSYDFNDKCIPLGVLLWLRIVENRSGSALLAP